MKPPQRDHYYRCNGRHFARGTVYGLSGKKCPSKTLNGDHVERLIWADHRVVPPRSPAISWRVCMSGSRCKTAIDSAARRNWAISRRRFNCKTSRTRPSLRTFPARPHRRDHTRRATRPHRCRSRRTSGRDRVGLPKRCQPVIGRNSSGRQRHCSKRSGTGSLARFRRN